MTAREQRLHARIQCLTWLFIGGLVFSGVTAIPLVWEADTLVRMAGAMGADSSSPPFLWMEKVRDALHHVNANHPFLFYGTDWLAFGHFVIAIAFVGALRDPVRNRWLFRFGMIACVLVIPYAWVFGAFRGIPVWWRLMDCSFGVFGFIPLWLCARWCRELESLTAPPGTFSTIAPSPPPR